MARFKPYVCSQGLTVPVNLKEQIQPGTFEYALHHLIEARYDDSFLANIRLAEGLGRINYRARQKVDVVWRLWSIMHNIGKIAHYRSEFGVKVAVGG